MNIVDNITRTPIPYDADRGADVLAALPWAQGDMAKLVAGTAGCSPYLAKLLEQEADWFETAAYNPEGAVAELYTALHSTPPDHLAKALRQGKRRIALLTAMADLAGVWSLEQVTGTLSDYADLACQLSFQAAVGAEIKRKKLPGATEDDIATAGGIAVFAMGKGGARELNYSSDIDLICLFDETRYSRDDYQEARASLVRATRKASAMMNDVTGDGYVFRVDLRLRPDPSVTPVCMTMEAAERYYESLGRTWERAAWIKARPCAGDIDAGTRFQDVLRPFVWRRHLDFAAIEDAHNMRLAIRKHKGTGGPISLSGHNMKLGRGGIREIEFFTQTRQLIAGGRDPELRTRGTVPGLQSLAEKGWIPDTLAAALTDHYRHHREVEHRLQMIQDTQTHSLPNGDDGMDRLAAFMGISTDEMKRDLRARLDQVHTLTENFFAPDEQDTDIQETKEDIAITNRWRTYPALRSERAVEIFDRLKPDILGRLRAATRPDEALLAFDGFLEQLPAGVQLFSLFEANPQLVDLLIDIVSTSPDLAQYLARNASVFDAVIGGAFFDDWPDKPALQDDLRAVLERERDYETRLDATRRWGKEWHFRTGVHLLRGLIDAADAGRQYSDLAEVSVAGLLPYVKEEFARKHGPCPGRGAVVLGMGSLGAGRLHARSDLDLIVIYDPDGQDSSEGPRPLASRAYYARLTQALVTAMTAPMAEGKLYEIDMRLRPSGNQGPVATSLEAFRNYQENDAWTWEHLALTRARVIAGPEALAADVAQVRSNVLSRDVDRASILQDVSEMRDRIASAKGAVGGFEPKLGQGRMQDIELIAQTAALLSGTATRDVEKGLTSGTQDGWLSAKAVQDLTESYHLYWALQTGVRLISSGVLNRDSLGAEGATFLCRLTNCPDIEALESELVTRAEIAAAHINAALPEKPQETT